MSRVEPNVSHMKVQVLDLQAGQVILQQEHKMMRCESNLSTKHDQDSVTCVIEEALREAQHVLDQELSDACNDSDGALSTRSDGDSISSEVQLLESLSAELFRDLSAAEEGWRFSFESDNDHDDDDDDDNESAGDEEVPVEEEECSSDEEHNVPEDNVKRQSCSGQDENGNDAMHLIQELNGILGPLKPPANGTKNNLSTTLEQQTPSIPAQSSNGWEEDNGLLRILPPFLRKQFQVKKSQDSLTVTVPVLGSIDGNRMVVVTTSQAQL